MKNKENEMNGTKLKSLYTGREIIKREQNNDAIKKGTFLDRFKGRTIQMGKEGHLSVVNSTKMPIKPSYESLNQSYSNDAYVPYQDMTKSRERNSSANYPTYSKSNYEALSPEKRAHALANKFSSPSASGEYNLSQRNALSNVGNNIMRYKNNDNFSSITQKVNTSHSLSPPSHSHYQSSFVFRSSFQIPAKSVNTGPMASSLQGFNDTNELKSSFYSSRNGQQLMNTSSYSASPSMAYPYYQSYQMRNSGYSFTKSIASNSNGFYPTAVSTPAYPKDNPNAKITSKAEEMMRRAEELSRMIKPQVSEDKNLAQIK